MYECNWTSTEQFHSEILRWDILVRRLSWGPKLSWARQEHSLCLNHTEEAIKILICSQLMKSRWLDTSERQKDTVRLLESEVNEIRGTGTEKCLICVSGRHRTNDEIDDKLPLDLTFGIGKPAQVFEPWMIELWKVNNTGLQFKNETSGKVISFQGVISLIKEL